MLLRTTTDRRTHALLALLALTGAAQGATLNVPSAMYPSLPIAITAAASGDEIVLAAGTYLAVPGFAITNKRLTIRGATGDPDDVVLDGFDVPGTIVLTISGAASDGTVLDSITVTGGVSTSTAGADGAGIVLSSANVTIMNCIIRDNTLIAPDGDGAGLRAVSSDVMVIDSKFLRNTAIGNAGSDGVAISLSGGHLEILDSEFDLNGIDDAFVLSGSGGGGAIRVDAGSLAATRSTFSNNRSGLGGAIFVGGDADLVMNACRMIDNIGIAGGAVLHGNAAGTKSAVFRNCLFEGNLTTGNDAAVQLSKASEITNCTFANNIASGSYIIGGTTAAGAVKINNSIVWGNTATTHIIPAPMSAVVRHNTFQLAYAGGAGSTGNSTVDPQFVNLGAGDFRLSSTSPAIDAGNTGLYAGPFSDLAGNPRGVDDPSSPDTGVSIDGPVIDRGCFEFQVDAPAPTCPGDLTGDDFVNVDDLNEVLGNWNSGCE